MVTLQLDLMEWVAAILTIVVPTVASWVYQRLRTWKTTLENLPDLVAALGYLATGQLLAFLVGLTGHVVPEDWAAMAPSQIETLVTSIVGAILYRNGRKSAAPADPFSDLEPL